MHSSHFLREFPYATGSFFPCVLKNTRTQTGFLRYAFSAPAPNFGMVTLWLGFSETKLGAEAAH